jgi:valyl-tRNA synthetase
VAKQGIEWYKYKFQKELTIVNDHFDKYRISDALMSIYKLIWDDFCSWLLELVKPSYGKPIDSQTHAEVVEIFENNLRLLHPFMPFLSEELWHVLGTRSAEEALIVSSWPKSEKVDENVLRIFSHTMEMVSSIRAIRMQKNIPMKTPLQLIEETKQVDYYEQVVCKLASIDSCTVAKEMPEQVLSFRVGTSAYFMPFSLDNPVEEMRKLVEELSYQKGFLQSVQKKLSNSRFVDNAPESVVAVERKKESDAHEKIKHIEQQLAQLQR